MLLTNPMQTLTKEKKGSPKKKKKKEWYPNLAERELS